MNALHIGAHIEPLTLRAWRMEGPWGTVLIERTLDGGENAWTIRSEKSKPSESIGSYARCESALSDAYSRVMGYTK